MPLERRKVESSLPVSAPAAGASEIERLREKYQALQTRKTRAETNLENARHQLEKLKKEARETFGTDDLAALEAQLAQRRADNQARTAQYRGDLEKIEAHVQAVEEQYQRPPEGGA